MSSAAFKREVNEGKRLVSPVLNMPFEMVKENTVGLHATGTLSTVY